MSVHTDRLSKFLFGCLIVVLCWIIGAGQLLNRRNDISPDLTTASFDIQQTASSATDEDVFMQGSQGSTAHSSLAFYCFLASIVIWVSSVVARQIVIGTADPTSADRTAQPAVYPAWNAFDFIVSLVILSTAVAVVARALGGQFALLICVTAIVCYMLASGPQKIADYCRLVVRWLDQRHSASMVNGDLPLGEVGWKYDARIILPTSWWRTQREQHGGVRVSPIGLILFGVGVIVTFGLMTLFDKPSSHAPTLLSIPNSLDHTVPLDEAPRPLDPAPRPLDPAPRPLDLAPRPLDLAPRPIDSQPISSELQRTEESFTNMRVSARAPELVQLSDKTVKEGELLYVMAQVKDANLIDGRLQFRLGDDAPRGATIDPDSGLFSWRPTAAGTYDITIAAATDSSATAHDETTLRVVVTPQPRPPVIARIDDRSVNEGESIVVPVMAKSPGNPQAALRFSLDRECPEGATIDAESGVFTWTPERPGTYPIMVRCESLGSSRLSDQTSFNIVVSEVNEPPQLAEIGNKIVRAGDSLTIPVKVKSPGRPAGQLLFAMAEDAPPGAQIDSRRGLIRWDVDADVSAGEYPITVRLRNSARPRLNDQITFHVNVLESIHTSRSEERSPGALELAPINDHSVNAGNLLRFKVNPQNTGRAIGELEFNLESGAPDGASINSRTGLFTWRPTDDQASRQYWMTVRACDVENPSRCGEARFSVKVNRVEQDSQEELVIIPRPARSFDVQDSDTPAKESATPRFIDSAPDQPIAPKEREPEEEPVPLPTPLEDPEAHQDALPAADGIPTETPDSVLVNSIGIHLVPIPEGVFQMGSGESTEELATLDDAESLRFKDELPQHPVRLTRPFFMGKYEVTVGQFRQFVEQTGYETEAERAGAGAYAFNATTREFEWGKKFNWQNTGWSQTNDHPVVNVSWNDCVAFCRWLSEKEGRTYRLPTEAEWEYACRAGTETRYASGNSIDDLALVANLGDESFRQIIRPGYSNVVLVAGQEGPAFTTPVGKFASNAFGLHDMHGNVFEWCNDFYASTYYQQSPLIDPIGPATGTKQVIRGGSFFNSPFYSRSSFRNGFAPNARVPYLGFRVAMESEELQEIDLIPQPVASDDFKPIH
jgi:formylglycine-generating enzyme required for sulfatase activity